VNYRHIFHAGNFADVFKHVILLLLLDKLTKKNKPFAVLDAFAGNGIYDLSSSESKKTLESKDGILRFFESCDRKITHPIIKQYLDIVRYYNVNNQCINYPGSPYIITHMLRENDRLIACELQKDSYESLKYNVHNFKNVHAHHINAYDALKAFCPFKENRGCIFIDPPFESPKEFDNILSALKLLNKRFRNVVIIIWYPVKNQNLVNDFYKEYQKIGFKEDLRLEFALKKEETMSHTNANGPRMNVSGILIINPPEIASDLDVIMKELSACLN
jgi:23S rRNA (adenine2030-N6)-methyltransferase